ncbi:uncharacterized protein LOC107266762 [Cephus cinctus]|uniref:Uncharacterized protein LOC107266762 n=1 Tax=Cephus cinctus TaxID=211228 RepID=A0AAJ7BSA2_CEPCN|nr:uncharacterized protein LOC107266762 [Cephus cinctus]
MSCSVKISSGKSWSGSQRRINSLAEESSTISSAPTSSTPGTNASGIPSTTGTTSGAATGSTGTTGSAGVLGVPRIPPRPVKSIAAKKGEDASKLLKYIDDNVIGKNGIFFGPFGRRKVVYCDYTASGRSLQFLEEYITREVLPCLGDTRASTSICSLQSSLFRHEARDIVRHAVGAGEQDAVLFTGHGTAGALRTLLRHLDLSRPTVVFVGPFEHHVNLRPWREHGVKVVRIAETREGFLDLNDLERRLAKERATGGSQLVGCFNAASCITGVLADDVATTLLLHQHGALSIWDYTSAAPYVQMDMNPHLPGVGETTVHKDAIIFAGHKFIGGVQSPGVLVMKRSLVREEISPEDMRDSHRYLRDPELREESGTAAVVETIRCGLAVQLKENVTPQAIVARQDKISKQVLAHVRTIPELILLGSTSQNVKRLPIFSFMVRHPRGTFLHHNFVCAVLNDVFGVQARGGCACTGRYAHDLMGINEELAKEYESILLQDECSMNRDDTNTEMLRPGFARLAFPYFMSEAEVAFVLEALKMVATEGWKLLPQYVLNPDTGEWRHHTNSVFKDRKWLGSIRYTDGKMNTSERRVSGPGVFPQSYSDCLQTARNIFNRARKMAQRYPLQIDHSVTFTEQTEQLRWFILPNEAQDLLLGNSQNVKQDVPFNPVTYRLGYGPFDGSSNSLLMANGIRRLNSDIPRTGNVPVTPNSPRHHSLPVLTKPVNATIPDMKKQSLAGNSNNPPMTVTRPLRSTISPPLTSQLSLPEYGSNNNVNGQKSPATCPSSPMPVRFAVGEAVTPAILGTPAVTQLIASEQNISGRTRCNSLGSSGTSPPILSPQTMVSLGINSTSRHRHCSCSSQTELNSLEFESGSPTHSLGHVNSSSNSDMRVGRSSPVSNFSQSSEDLHAYLKEVTKELATEIKSEIREVISKVDDVLSETNTSENTPQHHSRSHSHNHSEDKHDSFSASDIAEYLMEFSKEMASEVKSEIRCMVNAVDGLHRFSPDTSASDKSSNGCGSPERILPKTGAVGKLSELSQESKMSSECSSDETVIYVLKPREAEGKTDDEEHSGTEIDIKTLPKIYSTINSVSSQDSGINLSFHENDRSVDSELRRSSSAESNSNSCRRLRMTGNRGGKQNRVNDLSEDEEAVSEYSGLEDDDRPVASITPEDGSSPQWHCPPKNIWKPAVEAMQEFDMIKDNDRIMVCLSGGKDSLSLLHTLHQYRFYVRSKGINFEIGAATVDGGGYDPLRSMSYLKALNVPYFYEEQSATSPEEEAHTTRACSFCSRSTRAKLYSVAKRNGYNVLALGQHLDDLTESFLMSVFHNGKLRTMKAHYYIREQDLRVIRPFVYVREKALRQFTESKKLPVVRNTCTTCKDAPKRLERNKELIAQQEQVYPRLYWSLRSALQPLIIARGQNLEINQQKRHRRPRTNSFTSTPLTSAQQLHDSETDEEPVL